MKTLEELRKEMIDVKRVYDKFISDNSRELTDEEKINDPDYPIFGDDESEPRMFELTNDKLIEFNNLYKKMESARKKFFVRLRSEKIK
jgi:hypothetical protein